MARAPGPVTKLWYQWRMMRLPWRKRWLVGFDLQGNTFWEFKDALHAGRNRRIVKYPSGTHHGDVQVPPQWMQWLRHTRFEPPTLADQRADVVRQEQMKYLAAQADARWAAMPSQLDAPDKQQPIQMLESRDSSRGIRQTNANQENIDEAVEPPRSVQEEVREAQKKEDSVPGKNNHDETQKADSKAEKAPELKARKPMMKEPKDSPWKQRTSGNPGDDWQPQSWTPPPTKRRDASN
ncbi:hypothetical protein P154DRAFT_561099 [Amniculicola lignicola CBS 123094]|uniref:Uncharacterized protein n=1 Tax=Amniculicola lignicola CBS 123094 TaxID=1392246 RepID=A0A6A5WX22_9PLEO|nr:hypothetical protein P154DRAFT_561099 [Amniculicola lignicola CBS 123094]